MAYVDRNYASEKVEIFATIEIIKMNAPSPLQRKPCFVVVENRVEDVFLMLFVDAFGLAFFDCFAHITILHRLTECIDGSLNSTTGINIESSKKRVQSLPEQCWLLDPWMMSGTPKDFQPCPPN